MARQAKSSPRYTRRRRAPTPEDRPRQLWRVFPWDESAKPGDRFSPSYLPPQSGQGRFDLPADGGASAWYLAGTPEHAVGEKIQDLRNRVLSDEFLVEYGHTLAISPVGLASNATIADLCDPHELVARGIRPDHLVHDDRSVTQAISRALHKDEGIAGFRWWSALRGEWHTTVLFSDRLSPSTLTFPETPTALTLTHPAVTAAAHALAIEIERL